MDLFESKDTSADLLVEDLEAGTKELHDVDLTQFLRVIESDEVPYVVERNGGREAMAHRGELGSAQESCLVEIQVRRQLSDLELLREDPVAEVFHYGVY